MVTLDAFLVIVRTAARCPRRPGAEADRSRSSSEANTFAAAGKFRFRLKAANGEIIAASQGYETKANADKASRRSRRPLPTRSR
jgi:hypothetical protein